MYLATLVALVIMLANSVAANPMAVRQSPISVPLTRYINASGATGDLVQGDRERARSLLKNRSPLTPEVHTGVGVTSSGVIYTASVGIGSPPTHYNLIIDTGSSNTWIGAGKPYVRTKTSVRTSDLVSVDYGSGSFTGVEYTDTVTIAPDLVISRQSIGVALSSDGFKGYDGILGFGPVDLTIGTLIPDIGASIPTVMDNLFKSRAIPSDLLSVSFEPSTKLFVKNGELTFGGTDPTKFNEPITYAPLTTKSPDSSYWGVELSIQYGESASILQISPCIIDTGTTLIYIPTDAFKRYQHETGATLDKKTQLLSITPAQFRNLKSLFFTIGGRKFEFTANAQIWPRALNSLIGGKRDSIYLVVGDIGSTGANSFGCVNGYAFLERHYSVFDTTKKRVGFATTQFTMADIN